MGHLDEGTLRRLVDEPFTATDSQRRHYESCERCREQYGAVVRDAQQVQVAMAVPAAGGNTLVALQRLHMRLEAGHAPSVQTTGRRPVFRRRSVPRWGRVSVTAVGVSALLAGLFGLTPAGSLAQSVIDVFQPDNVAQVQLTTADIRSLAGLRKYGTFHPPRHVSMRNVPNVAAAEAVVHMHVFSPASLPASVSGAPAIDIAPAQSASFTFSAAKAAAAAGPDAPAMPAQIDGSTLNVHVRTAVTQIYGLNNEGLPDLVVGQMRAPTIKSTGVSVQVLEDYILSLPDISPALAAQIRAIKDPTSVLPIPVPIDRAHAQTVTVQGVQGLAVGDNTGVGSGVIWEKDHVIYGVAGLLSQDDVLAVANSLK